MSLLPQPGNAFMCKVNSHRDEWSGSICSDAAHWNCGADAEFRKDYCANGDPRCFHIRLFDPSGPRLEIDGNGASWLLDQIPNALDDQLLLLWGYRPEEPRGIISGFGEKDASLFGVYRVKQVTRTSAGSRTIWTVTPHDDGWIRTSHVSVQRPTYDKLQGKYITEVDRGNVNRTMEEVERKASSWPSDAARRRFEAFRGGLSRWQNAAESSMRRLRDEEAAVAPQTILPNERAPGSASVNQPLKNLKTVLTSQREAQSRAQSGTLAAAAGAAQGGALKSAQSKSLPAAAPTLPADGRGPLVEEGMRSWIRDTFGADKLFELEAASLTKTILILRGEPGTGKSHLAMRLLDDVARERTLVVPVAATWRGREDLLGYVNPIHGRFEATPFTRFLRQAESAWASGDRKARLCVFEEFNLSQPEHWLSDVLSVSQFEKESDRRIVLAGCSDDPTGFECVVITPNVYFVATINNDHTTRPLSPRVLDRAAVITLGTTAKEALSRVGLTLDQDLVTAIKDLDFTLRKKSAPFSLRTALAVKSGVEMFDDVSETAVVDLILATQVLPKVRLMAHDATDERALIDLARWSEKLDGKLPRCDTIISNWKERLERGEDVVEA